MRRHAIVPCSLIIAGSLWGCVAPNPRPDEPAADRPAEKTMLLAEFDGDAPRVDPRSGTWQTVNDNIMGGRSSGGGEIRDGVMIFAGSTNTNGGGFSSVRARDIKWDLSAYNGIAARVRGDGRRYVFHIDTGLRLDSRNVFYRGAFPTDAVIDPIDGAVLEDGAWQNVFVPFIEFVPMVRGRAVTGRVETLDAANIRGIGLMIDDGLDGPFRLEVDRIEAEARATPTVTDAAG